MPQRKPPPARVKFESEEERASRLKIEAAVVRDLSREVLKTFPVFNLHGTVAAIATTLPAQIDASEARLPVTYEAARAALARCESIDECLTWSDKAAALAAYAKQSQDETLLDMAKRIRARAERRAGELLAEINGRGRNQHSEEDSGGAPTKLSQREAAAAAGMSKDQQVQAVRIARIPEDEFEAAVQGDAPPSVTSLAEMGRHRRPWFGYAPDAPRAEKVRKNRAERLERAIIGVTSPCMVGGRIAQDLADLDLRDLTDEDAERYLSMLDEAERGLRVFAKKVRDLIAARPRSPVQSAAEPEEAAP